MTAKYHGIAKLKHNIGKAFWSALTLISPVWNTKLLYFRAFRKKLDLKHPKTFNQKLLWLKLNRYMTDPLVIQCADKYLVRDYIKECGCEEILNDLLGAWDSPQEIDWNKLPSQFALKWNFGAGFNLICDNKEKLNQKEVVQQFRKWGRSKCWLPHSEMQYKYIPKKIICEKYLNDGTGKLPVDYKIYCFHGEPKAILVMTGREGEMKAVFKDCDWNSMEDFKKYDTYEDAPRPKQLEQLIAVAKKLSAPFPFVRADFFICNEKLYFGELTFTPAGGLYPAEVLVEEKPMGEHLDLNLV